MSLSLLRDDVNEREAMLRMLRIARREKRAEYINGNSEYRQMMARIVRGAPLSFIPDHTIAGRPISGWCVMRRIAP